MNEKNIGADQAKKKLEEVPSSKDAIQPGKQMGSNGPAIEGERQCPYCAVICLSTSDLANHNKFWHSNISTKSESVTGSKEKEKAQVVQSRRNLRQQNLSNFRGYKCYRCPHCPAMCDSQAQLNAHMSLCHSNASTARRFPAKVQAKPVVLPQKYRNSPSFCHKSAGAARGFAATVQACWRQAEEQCTSNLCSVRHLCAEVAALSRFQA